MVTKAKELLHNVPNASVHVGNGENLSSIPSSSIDFALSYIVFQHIPQQNIIENYMDETSRVLKPGGVLRFQFDGRTAPLYHIMHWLGSKAAWAGCPFSKSDVQAMMNRHGFQVIEITGAGTHYLWVLARKPRSI